MLSTYYRVTLTTVLCLRYDYVTDGEIEAQRIQLLSQGHKVIKPWDHGFGSRQSGFGSVLFTGKRYCPQTATFGEISSEDNSSLRTKHLSFMATLSWIQGGCTF